jgi:hypothetical protein
MLLSRRRMRVLVLLLTGLGLAALTLFVAVGWLLTKPELHSVPLPRHSEGIESVVFRSHTGRLVKRWIGFLSRHVGVPAPREADALAQSGA